MEIGRKNRLKVVKTESFGIYLSDNGDISEERVLLPIKQVPEGTSVGDELEVFIYRDSKDRLIATTNTPLIMLGELKKLKVVSVNKLGAFLDMGLERDLFLPYKEQTCKVQGGDEVLVTMYVDKSSRLAASMKVYHLLKTGSPYKTGDEVRGRVYEITRDFGVYVAVDDIYSARIPKKEFSGECRCGDVIRARVTRILEDGKLDLSLRDKAYMMLDKDAATVQEALKSGGGVLMLSDSSDPLKIRETLHMSKNAFKRAIGHLYKEGKILIEEDCIRSVK